MILPGAASLWSEPELDLLQDDSLKAEVASPLCSLPRAVRSLSLTSALLLCSKSLVSSALRRPIRLRAYYAMPGASYAISGT
eukprot:3937265-Rhodomonas_salina.3